MIEVRGFSFWKGQSTTLTVECGGRICVDLVGCDVGHCRLQRAAILDCKSSHICGGCFDFKRFGVVVSNVSRTRRRVHQRPASDCSALQTHSRIRGGGGSLTRQSWLLLFQAGRGRRHLPSGDLSTTRAQERWRMTLPVAEGAHSPHRRATRHHIWPSTAVFAPDCGATAVEACWLCIIRASSCDPVFSDV